MRLQTAAGLRTSSLAGFRAATAELAGALAAELPARRARGEEIVFNLTGGFKALHAVVQAMGARFADRVVCLFEGTDELLEIPRTL